MSENCQMSGSSVNLGHSGISDLGVPCLLKPLCQNTEDKQVNSNFNLNKEIFRFTSIQLSDNFASAVI